MKNTRLNYALLTMTAFTAISCSKSDRMGFYAKAPLVDYSTATQLQSGSTYELPLQPVASNVGGMMDSGAPQSSEMNAPASNPALAESAPQSLPVNSAPSQEQTTTSNPSAPVQAVVIVPPAPSEILPIEAGVSLPGMGMPSPVVVNPPASSSNSATGVTSGGVTQGEETDGEDESGDDSKEACVVANYKKVNIHIRSITVSKTEGGIYKSKFKLDFKGIVDITTLEAKLNEMLDNVKDMPEVELNQIELDLDKIDFEDEGNQKFSAEVMGQKIHIRYHMKTPVKMHHGKKDKNLSFNPCEVIKQSPKPNVVAVEKHVTVVAEAKCKKDK